MSERRLVMVGGILVDVVMYVPHLPVPGGDVLATGAVVTTGGGFNILAAASRQGLPAAYLGPHGTGRFGNQIRADLSAEGIAVSDGPEGCWLLDSAHPDDVRQMRVPLRPVTPTDSSGAGDCHLGTFAAGIDRGDEPAAAARWANAAAAISVQRTGPATGPTFAEVEAALATVTG